jgi:hypothetical protein
MAACAEQAQTNNAHDTCHTCSAQASMCRVKKYLGVEIGITSGSTSRTLTAFFFEENGIIYLNKLCALESISYKESYKLDYSDNTRELVARD